MFTIKLKKSKISSNILGFQFFTLPPGERRRPRHHLIPSNGLPEYFWLIACAIFNEVLVRLWSIKDGEFWHAGGFSIPQLCNQWDCTTMLRKVCGTRWNGSCEDSQRFDLVVGFLVLMVSFSSHSRMINWISELSLWWWLYHLSCSNVMQVLSLENTDESQCRLWSVLLW